MPHQLVYLALLAGSLAGPLALSFDRKVAFYRQFYRVWPAIVVPAALFIGWDVWFNAAGVWSFANEYTLGISWLGLPVEEWAFFLVVPYCSLFVYEVLRNYFPRAGRGRWPVGVAWFFVSFFVLMVVLNGNKLYTGVNFSVALLALLVAIYVWKQPELLGFFLLAWLVALLPKLVVNGILTSLPVVSYNPEHIIGLRVGTIPVEDFFYFFGLLLLNVMVYENLKRHKEV